MKLYEYPAAYDAVFAQVDEDGVLSDEAAQELARLETGAEQKGLAVASYFLNLDAGIEAMKEATARMVNRRQVAERHRDRLKEYLKDNMEQMGITKISCPHFEVSIVKNPPKLIVTDKGFLLDCALYRRVIPERVELDKKAITQSIKDGMEIRGAHLEQGTRLKVK